MSDSWDISYEHRLDAKTTLEVGDTFALQGEVGKRYKFIRSVTNEAGETWVDCFGGSGKLRGPAHKSRSVDPARIVRVKKKKPE